MGVATLIGRIAARWPLAAALGLAAPAWAQDPPFAPHRAYYTITVEDSPLAVMGDAGGTALIGFGAGCDGMALRFAMDISVQDSQGERLSIFSEAVVTELYDGSNGQFAIATTVADQIVDQRSGEYAEEDGRLVVRYEQPAGEFEVLPLGTTTYFQNHRNVIDHAASGASGPLREIVFDPSSGGLLDYTVQLLDEFEPNSDHPVFGERGWHVAYQWGVPPANSWGAPGTEGEMWILETGVVIRLRQTSTSIGTVVLDIAEIEPLEIEVCG